MENKEKLLPEHYDVDNLGKRRRYVIFMRALMFVSFDISY